jgi:hypothetical protein
VSEQPTRADAVWGRIVQAVCLSLFVIGVVRGGGPGFSVMFLAIVGAVFPTKDFRSFLRSWRNGRGQDGS